MTKSNDKSFQSNPSKLELTEIFFFFYFELNSQSIKKNVTEINVPFKYLCLNKLYFEILTF